MKGLTDRQREVLWFICKRELDGNIPPTLREIGLAFGINSTNGVNDHLRALERKGYIQRTDMVSRGIRVTHLGLEECDVDGGVWQPKAREVLLENLYLAAARYVSPLPRFGNEQDRRKALASAVGAVQRFEAAKRGAAA